MKIGEILLEGLMIGFPAYGGEFSNEIMSYYISRGITRVFQTTTFVEMKVLKLS